MDGIRERIKSVFDNIELNYLEKLASGLPDYPTYREWVGRVKELRDARNRALEAVTAALGNDDAEESNGERGSRKPA